YQTSVAPSGTLLPYPELPSFARIDTALSSAFFTDYGFENLVVLSNRYGLVVNDNALIEPREPNFQLPDNFGSVPSGERLGSFEKVVDLPNELPRPANLTLAFSRQFGTTGSETISVQPGARIALDTGGSLSISSEGSVWVRGDLSAPAGDISLSIA